MNVGYGRVSSTDQDLSIQLEILESEKCERIFSERISGTSTAGREQLRECLAFMRPGDVLLVTRLDRLARSMVDLTRILTDLAARGIGFRCVQQAAVDTTHAQGRLMLNILGSFAEFENDLRKERQKEGIAKAKAAGVYKGGRPKQITREMIEAQFAKGFGPARIAKELGCSPATVYRRAPGLFGEQPDWLRAKAS